MATTNKTFIQVDDEIIELKGDELKIFEADRKQMQDQYAKLEKQIKEQKTLKVSAYTKLGLTEEEINAIL